MTDITREQVIDYLSNLPVIQLAELVRNLEESWGVSAAPVMQTGAPLTTSAEPVEEQTEFDVILEGFGESKMGVIKIVREVTSLGLKEAKEKVEGAPAVLAEGISKDAADELKAKIEGAGGKVTIK